MKKTLLYALLLSGCGVFAQEFVNMPVSSGFNVDVIANGLGPALLSTTESFDNADFVLMATDYQLNASITPPAYALPLSGLFTTSTPGLSYQLASYSGENSLRLQEQFDLGILNFDTGVNATRLFVLTSTGSGSATLGGTIHFSDNSSQPIVSGVVPDWFNSTALPVVASGFGRVGRSSDLPENPSENPRLYQFEIAILTQNQTKTITSIEFTKLSDLEGAINIFAVSAEILGACPNPSGLAVTTGFYDLTASWTEPAIVPAQYGVYILPEGAPAPTASTAPSGYADSPTYTQTGLEPGQAYCVYIRSLCDPDTAPFVGPVCATTGQVSATSPAGVSTMYDFEPSVGSVTNCAGTLSVQVPDGFVIASVGTQYSMQTASNGWMSEQRSLLVCTTSGTAENALATGIGQNTGTFGYSRNNLNIANGLSGTVNFELRAWRTYGGGDCSTEYNFVVPNSWKVIVTLQPTLKATAFEKSAVVMHPNPAQDRVTLTAPQNIEKVQIYNALGQAVRLVDANDRQVDISLDSLPTGQYFVRIESAGNVETKGLVKL